VEAYRPAFVQTTRTIACFNCHAPIQIAPGEDTVECTGNNGDSGCGGRWPLKVAERRLAEAAEQMQQRIELERARREARAKSDERSLFIALVAIPVAISVFLLVMFPANRPLAVAILAITVVVAVLMRLQRARQSRRGF
jgi:hypothetical protein